MMKKLFELFVTFFKMGIVTFGGGLTMLPLLERVVVEQKKWATSEELVDYFALSQTTPGIVAVNVSTFVGYKIKGIAGGFLATLGTVTPSLIIITLISSFISSFEEIIWVQKALRGINVAVAALLTYTVISLCRKSIKNVWCALLFVSSFVLLFFFKTHTVIITMGAAFFGILGFVVSRAKEGKCK
ncbi:MAG: chromate transporter [Treponema sp.]|nr:chromate transporter [Treponema sp.]